MYNMTDTHNPVVTELEANDCRLIITETFNFDQSECKKGN